MSHSLVKDIFFTAIAAVIAFRSVSYGVFEWKNNRTGAAAVFALTALMLTAYMFALGAKQ